MKPAIRVLKAANLARLRWLVHGFSTRLGGFSQVYGDDTLNLGFTPDDTHAAVERNRSAFFQKIGAAS
jgi:copper oxidase (laccase) domain-containing protein